jgi:hypothetical protein
MFVLAAVRHVWWCCSEVAYKCFTWNMSCFEMFHVKMSCFEMFHVKMSCFEMFHVKMSCFEMFHVKMSCFETFHVKHVLFWHVSREKCLVLKCFTWNVSCFEMFHVKRVLFWNVSCEMCLVLKCFTWNIIKIVSLDAEYAKYPSVTVKWHLFLSDLRFSLRWPKISVFWDITPCSLIEIPTFQRILLPQS